MIPRGKPDIGWRDLGYGALACLLPGAPARLAARAETAWSPAGASLVCLAVRSGFDALLTALDLPPGSEVLMSAVTIPAMVTIVHHHGLVAVPLDLDMARLAVDPAALAAALTPRTRAIVVAHLFGSRMPLDGVVAFARRHNLLLIEDCAQAYAGPAYCGHPAADVRMFSFGPIKTHTALGGAVLHFRDPALKEQVRKIQAGYPRQSRWAYLQRIALFAVLKILARPGLLQIFFVGCRATGHDHDAVLYRALRGFAGVDLITRIRRQPATGLLRMLARRLHRTATPTIQQRKAFAARVCAALPAIARPGDTVVDHSHWIIPLTTSDPDTLARLLWLYGFDATCKASSLVVIPAPAGKPAAVQATQTMQRVIYLPVYPAMPPHQLTRLAGLINDFVRVHAPARD